MEEEIPALPDVVFPAFPPSLQTPTPYQPLLPFFFFLALWNWSVHQEKKGNECTLDSALNRLTHFIDDADDTLMILIKIGSWQADYVSIWIWLLWCLSAHAFISHLQLVCYQNINLQNCKEWFQKVSKDQLDAGQRPQSESESLLVKYLQMLPRWALDLRKRYLELMQFL